MLASDWSTRDHVITFDKSEAPRAPVSRFYSRQFSRRYFGGDWKPGSGRSTPTGKFFPSHVTLSSHEDHKAWATTHEYVKRVLGKAPKKQMADGAKDITKSGKQVFGSRTKRLMCWPHVNRNVEKRLKVLKRESKSATLDKQVKNDICHFQWATSEREYESNFKSLKDKYTKNVGKYSRPMG